MALGLFSSVVLFGGFCLLTWVFYRYGLMREIPLLIQLFIVGILFSILNLFYTLFSLVKLSVLNLDEFLVNIFKSGYLPLYLLAILIPLKIILLVRPYLKKIEKRKSKTNYQVYLVNNISQLFIYSIALNVLLYYSIVEFKSTFVSILNWGLLFIYDDFNLISKYQIESNLKVKITERIRFLVIDILLFFGLSISISQLHFDLVQENSLIAGLYVCLICVFGFVRYSKAYKIILITAYFESPIMTKYYQPINSTGIILGGLPMFLFCFSLIYSVSFDLYHCIDINETTGRIIGEPDRGVSRSGVCRPKVLYEYNVDGNLLKSKKTKILPFFRGYNCFTFESEFPKGKEITVYYSGLNNKYSFIINESKTAMIVQFAFSFLACLMAVILIFFTVFAPRRYIVKTDEKMTSLYK